jgi:thiamine phosphate synthase YjbQ (UPF0047 family)
LDEGITSGEGYDIQIINISRIKLWAIRNLSASSHLRTVILLEKDTLTVAEFLAKMGTWLMITQLEESSTKSGSVIYG